MNILSKRLLVLIIKELLTLFRDPKGRLILIAPPVIQLLVFTFAATLDVKDIDIAIMNQDYGKHSNEIVRRIEGSPLFKNVIKINSIKELEQHLDKQDVIASLYIPQDFSADLEAAQHAHMQVLLDGRRSNAAQIVNGYITAIISEYYQDLHVNNGNRLILIERNWFNENLSYIWSTVPSLVAILAMLITLVITALSVARERELGTFDQMLVSPLLPHEILLGKSIPAVIVGFVEGMFIWSAGLLIFSIPFTGSFLVLAFYMLCFIISIVGVGLFISSLSQTQQQAILGTFLFMVPAVTLSGYAAPVANMPEWLQTITLANPLQHALIAMKGLFLKGFTLAEVWPYTWPLLIISFCTLVVSGWSFSRKIG